MSSAPLQNPPCVTCGYTLRGLGEDGTCPECGTAISRSLRGDRLSAAAPQWLRGVVRGQRLIAIGVISGVLSSVAACALLFVFLITVTARPGTPRLVEDVFRAIIGIALLGIPAALCIGAIGVFLLTAPEARESERESPWSARNVARWSVMGAITAAIGVFATYVVAVPNMAWLYADAVFKLVLLGSITIAGVALLQRLEALVRRVPDEPLIEEIENVKRSIRWQVPAAGIYLLMLPGLRPTVFIGFSALLAIIGFVALVTLLHTAAWLVSIMRKCVAHFRTCLAAAESM